ncbi:phosphoribosylanthranilate isomerase [soil metagenome]
MRVKICGVRTRAEAAVAAEAGASFVGLVFFAASPRSVTLGDARWIAHGVPDGLVRVALTVDAEDAELEAIITSVPVDMLQLHGHETPDRVADVRARFGLPVVKAVGVSREADLAGLALHGEVADLLLVDARPPTGAALPGGNGLAFDWRLVRGRRWQVPWMLAGGLTPENVRDAVRLTGAEAVDVSSGVEQAPGRKDPQRIRAFVEAAISAERAA